LGNEFLSGDISSLPGGKTAALVNAIPEYDILLMKFTTIKRRIPLGNGFTSRTHSSGTIEKIDRDRTP
jgi:hypothetical protein